jgi:hypothetical protein
VRGSVGKLANPSLSLSLSLSLFPLSLFPAFCCQRKVKLKFPQLNLLLQYLELLSPGMAVEVHFVCKFPECCPSNARRRVTLQVPRRPEPNLLYILIRKEGEE